MTTPLIAILAFSANTQAAIALSDFDSGVGNFDGWTGLSCVNPGICALASSPLGLSHFTTKGVNNSGYIEATDPNSGTGATLLYGITEFPDEIGTWKHYGFTISPDDLGWQWFSNADPGDTRRDAV